MYFFSSEGTLEPETTLPDIHGQDYVDGSWATKGELPGIFDTEYGRVGIGALAMSPGNVSCQP